MKICFEHNNNNNVIEFDFYGSISYRYDKIKLVSDNTTDIITINNNPIVFSNISTSIETQSIVATIDTKNYSFEIV